MARGAILKQSTLKRNPLDDDGVISDEIDEWMFYFSTYHLGKADVRLSERLPVLNSYDVTRNNLIDTMRITGRSLPDESIFDTVGVNAWNHSFGEKLVPVGVGTKIWIPQPAILMFKGTVSFNGKLYQSLPDKIAFIEDYYFQVSGELVEASTATDEIANNTNTKGRYSVHRMVTHQIGGVDNSPPEYFQRYNEHRDYAGKWLKLEIKPGTYTQHIPLLLMNLPVTQGSRVTIMDNGTIKVSGVTAEYSMKTRGFKFVNDKLQVNQYNIIDYNKRAYIPLLDIQKVNYQGQEDVSFLSNVSQEAKRAFESGRLNDYFDVLEQDGAITITYNAEKVKKVIPEKRVIHVNTLNMIPVRENSRVIIDHEAGTIEVKGIVVGMGGYLFKEGIIDDGQSISALSVMKSNEGIRGISHLFKTDETGQYFYRLVPRYRPNLLIDEYETLETHNTAIRGDRLVAYQFCHNLFPCEYTETTTTLLPSNFDRLFWDRVDVEEVPAFDATNTSIFTGDGRQTRWDYVYTGDTELAALKQNAGINSYAVAVDLDETSFTGIVKETPYRTLASVFKDTYIYQNTYPHLVMASNLVQRLPLVTIGDCLVDNSRMAKNLRKYDEIRVKYPERIYKFEDYNANSTNSNQEVPYKTITNEYDYRPYVLGLPFVTTRKVVASHDFREPIEGIGHLRLFPKMPTQAWRQWFLDCDEEWYDTRPIRYSIFHEEQPYFEDCFIIMTYSIFETRARNVIGTFGRMVKNIQLQKPASGIIYSLNIVFIGMSNEPLFTPTEKVVENDRPFNVFSFNNEITTSSELRHITNMNTHGTVKQLTDWETEKITNYDFSMIAVKVPDYLYHYLKYYYEDNMTRLSSVDQTEYSEKLYLSLTSNMSLFYEFDPLVAVVGSYYSHYASERPMSEDISYKPQFIVNKFEAEQFDDEDKRTIWTRNENKAISRVDSHVVYFYDTEIFLKYSSSSCIRLSMSASQIRLIPFLMLQRFNPNDGRLLTIPTSVLEEFMPSQLEIVPAKGSYESRVNLSAEYFNPCIVRHWRNALDQTDIMSRNFWRISSPDKLSLVFNPQPKS